MHYVVSGQENAFKLVVNLKGKYPSNLASNCFEIVFQHSEVFRFGPISTLMES